MKTIELKFNLENTCKIIKKYFLFKRRQEFKKIPSYFIFGVSLLLITSGLILTIDIFVYMGLIIFFSISIFLLYYYIIFQIAHTKYKKDLFFKSKNTDLDFRFSFNSDEIIQEYTNLTIRINWILIKKYQENQNDLYLYYEQSKLFIIISESEFGSENYEEFKNILKEKVINNNK